MPLPTVESIVDDEELKDLLWGYVSGRGEGVRMQELSDKVVKIRPRAREVSRVARALQRLGFVKAGELWRVPGKKDEEKRKQERKRFSSKYRYNAQHAVMYGGEFVCIPEEALNNLNFYAEMGIAFPGRVVVSGNHVEERGIRLRVERDPTNRLGFILRGRRDKPKKAEPHYWEIRVHIGTRWATVHVTKATEARFRGQVWQTWDKKLVSDGLATELERIEPLEGELLAYRDPANKEFRVTIRHADPRKLPQVTSLEYLRGSDSATAAWEQWYADRDDE